MECVNTRMGEKIKDRSSLGLGEKITLVKSGGREIMKKVSVFLSGSPLAELSTCSFP